MSEEELEERTQRPEFPKDTEVVVKATGRRMKVWKDQGDLNIMCYSHNMQCVLINGKKHNEPFAELHTLDELLVNVK